MSAIDLDCGKAVIVVMGMRFQSQPQSWYCEFDFNPGPRQFVIFAKTLARVFSRFFVSHVHFLDIIFEKFSKLVLFKYRIIHFLYENSNIPGKFKGARGSLTWRRSKSSFLLFLTEGSVSYQMLLLDQKILFLAKVIEFQNPENTGNYSTQENFKRDFPKMDIFGISKSISSYSF